MDIFVDNLSRIPRENAGIRTVSISRRKNSRDLFSAGGKKPSNLWLYHREPRSFIRKNSPHGKNDFAEGSKILLDIDLKIILLDHQNNFVGILKITSNAAKKFDILATSLSVLRNYFDSSTKLFFLSVSS